MQNIEKRVVINMTTEREDYTNTFIAFAETRDASVKLAPEKESFDFRTDGILAWRDGRVVLEYDDSVLFDGEKTGVEISFDEKEPGIVSLIRHGSVSSAMVYEQGKRHISAYNTPYMVFELCVNTIKVSNKLLNENNRTLELDYTIEIRGSKAERTKMKISVKDDRSYLRKLR
jgi:uncharacterized beta-barrel protein YwiB (DUF1934 family)